MLKQYAKDPIFVKLRNSLLGLEKNFKELQDRELKDRAVKTKREINKK